MAILCLANDLEDLRARLGRIILGFDKDGNPVTAEDIKVAGSMAVLLSDALMPNLVQTLENTPAIIHGGPFANIAHGCNSVQATKLGLKLADYVVTEAGFAADLGAEKFFDIKCRYAGLVPDAVVLIATIRALKTHGGVAFADLKEENIDALNMGLENLQKHVENMQLFNVPVVVAINKFPTDTDAEVEFLDRRVKEMGSKVVLCDVWAKGGEGGADLAREIVRMCSQEKPDFKFLYDLKQPIKEKIEAIATKVYGADGVDYTPEADAAIERYMKLGYNDLPICMAKTQASLSDDKTKVGRPRDWRLTVREVRLNAGSGFIVPVCGKMMTMPGLPKSPAAEKIDLVDGKIVGLF
jgi:formate--tetrahydrofolate ligase